MGIRKPPEEQAQEVLLGEERQREGLGLGPGSRRPQLLVWQTPIPELGQPRRHSLPVVRTTLTFCPRGGGSLGSQSRLCPF